jgi:hypothetical protein
LLLIVFLLRVDAFENGKTAELTANYSSR